MDPYFQAAHPHFQAVRWLFSLLGHGTVARTPAQDGPHVLSPSPGPGDSKGSLAAADTPGSYVQLTGAKFLPIPHLPTPAVRIWPWVFIMLKPEDTENPFFPARAEPVLSMNRTRV